MSKISIKLKVTLWYILVMTVISGTVLLAMMSLSRGLVMHDATARIIGTVEDLSRKTVNPRGEVRVMPGFRFFDKGVYAALYDSEKNIIGGEIPFEFESEIEFCDDDLKQAASGEEKYLTYVKEVRVNNGSSMWIKAVMPISAESRMLQSVGTTNVIIALILILAAAGGGYLIIKHSFKPVDKISKTAKEISESSDLTRRINMGGGNDEIYRLADTFDRMLDKIEATLENEKQFTSDASHELRTPVAVINSECEYIIDCAKNLDEAKESVLSIKHQSDKMSKLISELLTISRMDKNTQKTNFEDVDISELLSFVCDEQEEIHDGTISLVKSIKPEIHAEADRFLITRLFINLISNAYQYGRENGEIKVMLDENDGSVAFTVSDNGIGISAENLPKIWERFYQVDTSRSNENGSMGLGLSMVKWIAECHGGKVTAESKLGEGTVFSFTMPKRK